MEHRSGVRMEMDRKRDDEAKRKKAIQEVEAAADFALTDVIKKIVKEKPPCPSCSGTDHKMFRGHLYPRIPNS
jgi:hypothetical protein